MKKAFLFLFISFLVISLPAYSSTVNPPIIWGPDGAILLQDALCFRDGVCSPEPPIGWADTGLDNLTSPTSVNQHLLPSAATKTLGSLSSPWGQATLKQQANGTHMLNMESVAGAVHPHWFLNSPDNSQWCVDNTDSTVTPLCMSYLGDVGIGTSPPGSSGLAIRPRSNQYALELTVATSLPQDLIRMYNGGLVANVDKDGKATFVNVTAPVSSPFSSKTTTYTVTLADQYLALDAAGAPFSVNLVPCNASSKGHMFNFKRTNAGANKPTIVADGADTIDGLATLSMDIQYEADTLNCNGSGAWFIF